MGAEVAAALLCYRVPTFLQSSSDFPLKVSRAIFFERDRSLALKRAGSPSLASAGVEVSEASSLSNRIIRALSEYQSSPISPGIGIARSSCSGAIRLSQGCGAGAGAGAGAAGADTFWSEPEPEPEPQKGLLGAGAGAGAVKNGAAPAPKRDTIVEK